MDSEAVNISSNISREEIMQIILDSEQTKKRLQKKQMKSRWPKHYQSLKWWNLRQEEHETAKEGR